MPPRNIRPSEPETPQIQSIHDWVGFETEHGYRPPPASRFAARRMTKDLFLDMSDATIALCGPISDDAREQWTDARAAVAEELASRVESVGSHTHDMGDQ